MQPSQAEFHKTEVLFMGNIIPATDVTASALNAERIRLDVVAQNLANINTTHGPDGNVYRRKQVVFESVLDQASGANKVQVSSIQQDSTPLVRVHNPGHPDADKDGMVTMPNVNMLEEIVDMMTASRSYEANLQALRTGRQFFHNALDIGSAK